MPVFPVLIIINMKNYLLFIGALVILLPFLLIIQHFTGKIWLHDREYFALVAIFLVGIFFYKQDQKNKQPNS